MNQDTPMIPESRCQPESYSGNETSVREDCHYVLEDTEISVSSKLKSEDESNRPENSDRCGNIYSPEENIKARASWGGKLEFIFTMVGYAVGLGNVWRFPYLCYKNGGGAFLLPYTIMLAVVGLPLFYMEVGIGQYASLGPITIWKMNPLLKGLGYAMVIVSWLISVYYNVIESHVMYFLYASFTSELPWISRNNKWNTEDCRQVATQDVTDIQNGTLPNSTMYDGIIRTLNTSRTPSEEYYRYQVLQQTDSIDNFGTIQWHLALTLFLSWLIVFLVLLKGIKSLGKAVYFTAIFPYVMLTVLFIRGITLPGALLGIEYYLKPDFQRLLDPNVWSDAATQIFYSLGSCTGSLIAMASYNKFNNNCFRDSVIVSIINCCTSIFAGFVIFSVLGFMATEKGVDVKDVAQSGKSPSQPCRLLNFCWAIIVRPGLVFVVYPEALSRMPVSPLWSVFFFFMMLTLGFGSQFSYVETVLIAIGDEFPHILRPRRNNIIFRAVIIGSTFLLGLPMVCSGGIYLLNIVDFSVGGFPLLVVGFVELITVSWIYGINKFDENIRMMIGRQPGIYWKICWRFVSPFLIAVTTILTIAMYKEPTIDGKKYPAWAHSLSWMISLCPILAIPVWFLYKFCVLGGYDLIRKNMKPLSSFRPIKNQSYRDVELTVESELNPTTDGFNNNKDAKTLFLK